jgi:hypothetical protein
MGTGREGKEGKRSEDDDGNEDEERTALQQCMSRYITSMLCESCEVCDGKEREGRRVEEEKRKKG